MIFFIYDVLLQFLYFSKILDFVCFRGSSQKLRKYLLKSYVLFGVCSFRHSIDISCSTRQRLRIEGVLLRVNGFIFGNISNEPVFLRWKCQGQVG